MIHDVNIMKLRALLVIYFNDFIEAINTLGKESCGFKSSVTIEKTSDLFLASGASYEDVEKNGIVALVFEQTQNS